MLQREGAALGLSRDTRYVGALFNNFLVILIHDRTSFFLSLSLQMETGFSPDQRIVVSNSGTQEPATPNSCCKATRTPLLLVLVICALESGVTSHILERMSKRRLILGIP
jgi:hypothetical protein